MKPKHRNKRIAAIAVSAVMLGAGAFFLFSALQENTQFFYDPSEILAPDFVSASNEIRIGGLVMSDTVVKGKGLETTFKIADFPEEGEPETPDLPHISVSYIGVLPDLFREGQGVVITGVLIDGDSMIANDVLAKHDENYQPKKDRY